MPPPKSRNKNLLNNLQAKNSKCVQTETAVTDSKCVQTETMMIDLKCVKAEQSDDRTGEFIELLNSASLSEKCEILERIILSETPNLKVSCDQCTLLPSSTIVDISETKPGEWLMNVHSLLKAMGDALSKVILFL